MGNIGKYESDFYAWAMEQAALLRSGRIAEADMENIAEEIESMGRSEKRELVNRLTVLVVHLLKWRYQPALRGNGWRLTIREQRRAVARHLRDNPSLRAGLGESLADAYGDALIGAQRETGFAESTFPASCPWSFDEAARDDFLPD